jgi:hypothetical protein
VKVAFTSPENRIEADVLEVNDAGAPVNTGALGTLVSTVHEAVAASEVLPA